MLKRTLIYRLLVLNIDNFLASFPSSTGNWPVEVAPAPLHSRFSTDSVCFLDLQDLSALCFPLHLSRCALTVVFIEFPRRSLRRQITWRALVVLQICGCICAVVRLFFFSCAVSYMLMSPQIECDLFFRLRILRLCPTLNELACLCFINRGLGDTMFNAGPVDACTRQRPPQQSSPPIQRKINAAEVFV